MGIYFASFTADGLAVGMENGGVGQRNGVYRKRCDRAAAKSYMDGWGERIKHHSSRWDQVGGERDYEVGSKYREWVPHIILRSLRKNFNAK